MNEATELVKLIKKAALSAVEAEKPAAVCFGKVISVSPLKISVEQRLTLGEGQLVLTGSVRDHGADVEVSCRTEEESENAAAAHRHCLKGKKRCVVLNGLKKGEDVILLRIEGGQRFLVLDRVFDAAAEGEWIE